MHGIPDTQCDKQQIGGDLQFGSLAIFIYHTEIC